MSGNTSEHIILKCGTDVVTDGLCGQSRLDIIAHECIESRTAVTIVSSGAVREGEQQLGYGLDTPEIRYGPDVTGILTRKELAGVGARHLMNRWGEAFLPLGRQVAQIWVTPANLADSGERSRIGDAIRTCHRYGIVPVVNENDVVSADRRGMDNDVLAVAIANISHADAVLFLTRVGGVYDKDPMRYPDAKRYDAIDMDVAERLIVSLPGTHRTGGMRGKLLAAIHARVMGMRVAISGVQNNTIRRFVAGESVETMICLSLG